MLSAAIAADGSGQMKEEENHASDETILLGDTGSVTDYSSSVWT